MKCFFDEIDQACLMMLKGEFTTDHVDNFRRGVLVRLDEQRIADFIVDCSELEYIDSQGIESLLWLSELASERLGQVRLVNLPEHIQTVLHMTRLTGALPAHGNVRDAIKNLQ